MNKANISKIQLQYFINVIQQEHLVIRYRRFNKSTTHRPLITFVDFNNNRPLKSPRGLEWSSVIFAEFLADDPDLPAASPSTRRMTWKRSSFGRSRRAWEQARVSSEDDGMKDTEEESWTGGRTGSRLVSQGGHGRSCVIIYSTRSMALAIRVSGLNRDSLKSG